MKVKFGIPANTLIPTPDGLTYAKDLRKNDVIFCAYGKKYQVITKIENIGSQQIYRIKTDDGRSFCVSENYPIPIAMKMFGTYMADHKCTPKDIIGRYKISTNNGDSYVYNMPLSCGVEYRHKHVNINPAIAGVLYESIIKSKYLKATLYSENTAKMIADEFGFKYKQISFFKFMFLNKFGFPVKSKSILKHLGYPHNFVEKDKFYRTEYFMTSRPEISTFMNHIQTNVIVWPWDQIDNLNINEDIAMFTASKHVAYQCWNALISLGEKSFIRQIKSGYIVTKSSSDNITIVSVEKLESPQECFMIETDEREVPMFITEDYCAIYTGLYNGNAFDNL